MDFFDLSDAPLDEPPAIVQGVLTQWRRYIDADPSIYTLRYVLTDTATMGQLVTIPMSHISGDYWGVEVADSAFTSAQVGEFRWELQVTRISDDAVKLLDQGYLEVFGSTSDRRSHAEIMVAKIESLLQNRADDDVESYSIKARSITKMSFSELQKWRDFYKNEASNVGTVIGALSKRKPDGNRLFIRFVD